MRTGSVLAALGALGAPVHSVRCMCTRCTRWTWCVQSLIAAAIVFGAKLGGVCAFRVVSLEALGNLLQLLPIKTIKTIKIHCKMSSFSRD